MKCIFCGKNLSENELKYSDLIFPSCKDCEKFEESNLFISKKINALNTN